MTGSTRLPALYIPHGGGPCFFIRPEDNPRGMPPDLWDSMAAHLRSIDRMVGRRPRAVLVISAHWLTAQPTLGNAAHHRLLYDYYNFPPYTYDLTYPAPGAPYVAKRAAELLAAAGFTPALDNQRGLDHGVFIPFKLIYPDADVPIVPMSVQQDLDPAAHLAIGAALGSLRDEDVLIIGSGMSFHNISAMFSGADAAASIAFDGWLDSACRAVPPVRDAALTRWSEAPGGRVSHPAEEHLIPLMVAAGAARADLGRRTYSDRVGGKAISAFMFGPPHGGSMASAPA